MNGTAIRLEKVNRIRANNRTSDVIDDVFTTGLNNSKACPQGPTRPIRRRTAERARLQTRANGIRIGMGTIFGCAVGCRPDLFKPLSNMVVDVRAPNNEAAALSNAAVQNRGIDFIGPARYAAAMIMQIVFFLILQYALFLEKLDDLRVNGIDSLVGLVRIDKVVWNLLIGRELECLNASGA